LRDIQSTCEWLKRQIEELKKQLSSSGIHFIFLIHNFVPAYSSAFAYAEKGNSIVQMEVSWGLPEGLYYYAHDKYLVDTKTVELEYSDHSNFQIIKHINAKNNFVAPNTNGDWLVNDVSPNYIWRPAATNKKWIEEIAYHTRRIADTSDKGVSVMWFVGVDESIYQCEILPWHHEAYVFDEVPKQVNKKKTEKDKIFRIHTTNDFKVLRQIIDNENHERIKYVVFQPTEEELLRNKAFISEVGKLVNNAGAVIILEGGVLSHAYYQLKTTGVAIEVSEGSIETSGDLHFNKLVRDRIPDKIKRGGEIPFIRSIEDSELLRRLKAKLVEESFEVMDATSKDEVVGELADVYEVISAIAKKFQIDQDEIKLAQEKKRDKVGGFDDGIVLRKTTNPAFRHLSPTEVMYSDNDLHAHDEYKFNWSDKREKSEYRKNIKKIKIPITLSAWRTNISTRNMDVKPSIWIEISGNRIGSEMEIEMSIVEEMLQLSFFDDIE
jgi:predicted house-cleaning noncanonical NTP pyrophosphatase (MazG superfamily)